MTDQEILKKAVEKAEKNGYNVVYWTGMSASEFAQDCLGHLPEKSFRVIFSHAFAKDFFGEKDMWKETKCTCGGVDFHETGSFDSHRLDCARAKAKRDWKIYLPKMIMEENPISFLAKFL